MYLDAYPDAVCNDGSAAGYAFKRSSGGKANVWLVYLEGGGWCWDEKSCAIRSRDRNYLVSNAGWGAQFAGTGIQGSDPAQTPFADANLVYIKYCSSDLFVGNVSAADNPIGWHFRGHQARRTRAGAATGRGTARRSPSQRWLT